MTMQVSELIEKLSDEYDRDNYYNELFELTKIRKRNTAEKDKVSYNNKVADFGFSLDGLTKAEYVIISQIAMSRKALDIFQRDLGCLLDENDQRLSMLIVDDYRRNATCSLSRIYDECDDENIRNLITSLALVETLPNEFDEEGLKGVIEKVKLEIKKRKMSDLKEKIATFASLDPDKANEYLREYEQLIRELGGNNG